MKVLLIRMRAGIFITKFEANTKKKNLNKQKRLFFSFLKPANSPRYILHNIRCIRLGHFMQYIFEQNNLAFLTLDWTSQAKNKPFTQL